MAPALPVGAGEQVARATRGFNKSPTAHLLTFASSGRGLAVVDTPGLGWRRNGQLKSMRSDDDDNDDDDMSTWSVKNQRERFESENRVYF